MNGKKYIIQDIYNKKYGYQGSTKNKNSIDENGSPIPWITYPALYYLEQLDLSDKFLFEWGSGSSTLYYSKRVKKIITIEHDEDWYYKVLDDMEDNCNLKLYNLANYSSAINDFGEKYDIIVIDGEIHSRYECAVNAVNCLSDGGMIILDNSDWLANTTKFLRNNNLIQVDMAGPGPINNYFWCTSFFLKRDFNFKPNKVEKQPIFVKGGLENVRD